MVCLSFARFGLVSAVLTGALLAQSPAGNSATPPPPRNSKWVFSLVPTAFQRNPRIELSVITEVTAEGRKIPQPTAENPTYYLAQSSGFHAEGHGAQNTAPIQVKKLEDDLRQALAANGYRPTADGHPPTLALFFVWGMHNRLDPEYDDVGYKNLLSRAQLVGGTQFAKELLHVLEQTSLLNLSASDFTSPLHRFIERDDLTRQLMEQVFDDCYYIVVSAYDGSSLARGERKLLWRTKMSTPSQGLGLRETLPALISGGSPFFGREMALPAVVEKQLHRGGKVEVGEPQVKEYLPPTDAKTENKP